MQQNVTTLKGIEQGRATYAFKVVQEVSDNEPKKLKENYKSVAKKLPVLIKTNGLGQTLAFVKSKGGKRQER
jgi:CRISPR-associated protein Cmr5